ncbi:MAG: hypothetical protein ING84_07330 [Cytophagales bacterium]|jgi:hypothetical protein|nr:hypothetical protein [Cytophagales bacterium]MCA6369016.1 hypothetical protein [Cytophagales bacterium]MCA6371474.1 hypothetical protein [Cytophagales bacterium]MCA6377839.1 hypothetical protein [Cytophagales bacterium]MCA6385279.1 hypothetical protein [Cytophagales bacterium]
MAINTDEIGKKIIDFFKSHFGEALIYVLITTGGSLMPVWGGILLFKLFSINSDFWVFVDQGQFYLFSAALFTPSCYQLYRNKSTTNLLHSFVFLSSIFLLIVSAILFAGVSIFDLPLDNSVNSSSSPTIPFKINDDFLRLSSLVLFVFSISTALISQAIENKVRSGGPDSVEVSDLRNGYVDELSDNFDKLDIG